MNEAVSDVSSDSDSARVAHADTLRTNVPEGGDAERLACQLVDELRLSWQLGVPVKAESLLERHPRLAENPHAAIEIIYEEYCLRRAGGERDIEAGLLQRFPQFAGPLRMMLDCHERVLASQQDLPVFPSVGERIDDFLLIRQIACGSHGQVFLATQTALADRPVVLKVTPLDGAEHLSLARLQHTSIVPLYSLFDDTARNIRVLCMPYFGRTTLATLLGSLECVPLDSRAGLHIVDAIDATQTPSFPISADNSAARQMLLRVSFAQAICWISAALADALQFAHERGVVHLDLKPSNILLSNDGQPMLLDFHLAREPVRLNGPRPDNFGGTPPYMPPEQEIALRCLERGDPPGAVVDHRADIFALGVMMYESLGGHLPLTADSPPLDHVNPQVSTGLSDIVDKCIAERADDRYPDASALADDLRRHITNQPLIHVPNRSLSERFSKWRRRRLGRFRTAAMLAIVIASAALLISSLWVYMHHRHEQAELALYDGQRQLNDQNRAEAVKTLERGLQLVEHQPFEDDLASQLRVQLGVARQLHIAQQLHQLADQVRALYGAEAIPTDRLKSLARQCDSFWDKRDMIGRALISSADADTAADLQDIAIFAAHVNATLATRLKSSDHRRDALRLLDDAEIMFGRSAVLSHERLRAQPGTAVELSVVSTAATIPLPRSAWEQFTLGRAHMISGDLQRAMEVLTAAREREPGGRWSNFYYGLCAYRLARHEEAAEAFSTCIGTAPDVAAFYYNRGLTYFALGRVDHALADYNHALELEPSHASAALNRGVLHFQQQRYESAIEDLQLALDNGADAATAHYDIALVHAAANNVTVALEHARESLAIDPTRTQVRQLCDTLEHAISSP